MATIHVDGKQYEVDGSDNLLRACLDTERAAEGEALLARLRPVAPAVFGRRLDEFQQAFRQLRGARAHVA